MEKLGKSEILEKLYEKKGAETDSGKKERIDNICNIIHMIPEDDILKIAPEIKTFLEGPDSRLDYNILETVLEQLKTWIRKQSYKLEGYALETMNVHTKRILTLFLVIIALLAIAAVPFAVLNFIYGDTFFYGRGDDIASLLGTLDFALGACGFIWERRDDMKKKELHNAAVVTEKSGDTEKLIKVCNSNINSGLNFGNIGGCRNRVINK